MKGLLLILVAVFLTVNSKSITEPNSVKVEVYYETLCPDSIAFIVHQLYPVYNPLKDYIDLSLIPWGRASEEVVNGTKTFTCQHGETECYGNIAHSCAVKIAPVGNSTEFVVCSERSDAPADDAILKECAETADISWADIKECMTNGTGADLLSQNGVKTNLVSPAFIPTIVLDGVFDQEVQDAALVSFKELICDRIGYISILCKN